MCLSLVDDVAVGWTCEISELQGRPMGSDEADDASNWLCVMIIFGCGDPCCENVI